MYKTAHLRTCSICEKSGMDYGMRREDCFATVSSLTGLGGRKKKGPVFKILCNVLQSFAPTDEKKIEPGSLTRIGLDDPRDIPTLKMPYGLSVPELHAFAGIRRSIALASLLVRSWEEHKNGCTILDQGTASQVVFLIDEIETHPHPKPPQTSSPSWRITKKCLKGVFSKSLPALDSKRLQFQAVPAEIGAHFVLCDVRLFAANG